jgi:site-specific DNA recombinase
MRAAIYVRVSTDEQARHGFSLAEQREACRARATALGASTVTVFADEGLSGTTLDRPGLTQLREAVQAGEIDTIIVRDPDRLSRKLAHQLLLTEDFEKAGVRLEFLDFTWQDTPEGRLFYSIRGAIAEFEREKIRDRMVRGKTQKARQGGVPMGFYAYGYTHDTETGQVKIKESEAEVVRKIFSLFISKDMGINGVARWLNEEGMPTKKGRPQWHRQVVRQILQNPVYIGEWHYKDLIISVPSIINKEIWDKAQEKLREARRLWAGKPQNQYLLSGIITCSDCGNTMTGVCTKWWGNIVKRYTCRKNYQGAKNSGCHPSKSVPTAPIENAVWKQVCSWLQDPDAIIEEVMQLSQNGNTLKKELEQVQRHLKDVEKGRETVIEAISSGLVELDTKIKNKLGQLKRRKEKLELREKELITTLQINQGATARAKELREIAKELLARLDNLEFDEKKALVRALVSQVIVSGRGIQGGNGLRNVNITVIARLPEMEVMSDISNKLR